MLSLCLFSMAFRYVWRVRDDAAQARRRGFETGSSSDAQRARRSSQAGSPPASSARPRQAPRPRQRPAASRPRSADPAVYDELSRYRASELRGAAEEAGASLDSRCRLGCGGRCGGHRAVGRFRLVGGPSDPAPGSDLLASAGSDQVAERKTADDVVMTLGGSADTYVLQGEEYLEAGCHAVDPEEGDITSTVVVEGSPDTSVPGDYVVSYTASTADGSVARAERTVHVVESFEENATSLPVLMYHYVYTQDDQPAELNGNYLLDVKLEEQLRYLSEEGYYYPSFQEVKAFAEGTHTLPARSVVLTFDDCEAGFLKYGIPPSQRVQGARHLVRHLLGRRCRREDTGERDALRAVPISLLRHAPGGVERRARRPASTR